MNNSTEKTFSLSVYMPLIPHWISLKKTICTKIYRLLKRISPKFFDKTKLLSFSNWVDKFPKISPQSLNTYVTKGLLLGLLSSSKVGLQLKKNWFDKTLRRGSSHRPTLGALWSSSLNVLFNLPLPPNGHPHYSLCPVFSWGEVGR